MGVKFKIYSILTVVLTEMLKHWCMEVALHYYKWQKYPHGTEEDNSTHKKKKLTMVIR